MTEFESINRFITLEGHLLDDRRYQDWLDLYAEDATYWVPSWKNDTELCTDPSTQVSLIHYRSRGGLEDRVFRIGTGHSAASTPPPRTTHLASNVLITKSDGQHVSVRTSWATYAFRKNKTDIYHGTSEYEILADPSDNGWKVKKKKIVLANDYLSSIVDFNTIY